MLSLNGAVVYLMRLGLQLFLVRRVDFPRLVAGVVECGGGFFYAFKSTDVKLVRSIVSNCVRDCVICCT